MFCGIFLNSFYNAIELFTCTAQKNMLKPYGARCTVPRIYAPVDEATLEKVDKDAEGKSIRRTQ
jgi:hypothetical protein